MVYTKRKVETEQDRFGGYPYSASNQSASYVPYETYNAVQQEIETPSTNFESPFKTSYDSFTTTEEPSYEIEKEYTSAEVDEEVNPFKSKPFEMQNIQRRSVPAQKYKFNTHGKILMSVYCAICMVLIAFVIYNAFAISSLAQSNSSLEAVLSSKQQVAQVLQNEYDYLGSKKGVSSKLAEDQYFNKFDVATESNTVTISLGEFEEVPTCTVPSNWFDDVCEFLANLFN